MNKNFIPILGQMRLSQESDESNVSILDPSLSGGFACNHPCPSVFRPSVGLLSVFKYLRDGPLVFSDFFKEVRAL